MALTLTHISFYSATLVIIVTILFFTFLQQRTIKLNNKIFIIICAMLGLNAITMLVFEYAFTKRFESDTQFLILELSMYFYFVIHALVSSLFLVYVNYVTGVYARYKLTHRVFFSVPLVVSLVFLTLNPLNHWFFYFDETRTFHRGWAENILYILYRILLPDLKYCSLVKRHERIDIVQQYSEFAKYIVPAFDTAFLPYPGILVGIGLDLRTVDICMVQIYT